jgi:GAF domain-containing protein
LGITFFTPAPIPPDEARRHAAVLASGLLNARHQAELDRFAARGRDAVGTAMAALTVIFETRQYIVAAAGIAPGTTTRASSFCGHAILRPFEMLVIPDALADERFAGNPNVLGYPLVRFYAGAPIRTGEGQALGTLCAFDPAPRSGLEPRQAAELGGIADEIVAFAAAGRSAAADAAPPGAKRVAWSARPLL